MSIKSYKELIVWQKSIDLVVEVYGLVKKLPREELFALSSQIRRSVISIPSNIAEGQQRKTSKDFAHFLSIAKGSNGELQTQLYICKRLNFLSDKDIENAIMISNEVGKMLNKLIISIKE